MPPISTWRRRAAAGAVLLVAACTGGGEDLPEGPATDVGVTSEPCPDGVEPDRGCIYLGVLSDLMDGPYAALAVESVAGQRAFWDHVNEQGGVAGHDVDIDTHTRDTGANPEQQAEHYGEIEAEVLALAQSFGTEPTREIAADMDDDGIIGVPLSSWSGWADHEGVLLPSGPSSCEQTWIALDWVADDQGEPTSVMAIGFDDTDGADLATGVEAWAEANGVDFVGFVATEPNALVGSQEQVVAEVTSQEPDVVVLWLGPAETADVVGGAANGGYQGQFLGAAWSWTPALLESGAVAALEALYLHVGPWEGIDGDSAAHAAMRDMLDGAAPVNDGYVAGWVASYPLLAALETAAATDDLTRASVRAAVDGLEVDYDGALPERTFGRDGGQVPTPTAVVSRPDADAPLGLTRLDSAATPRTAPDEAPASACLAD